MFKSALAASVIALAAALPAAAVTISDYVPGAAATSAHIYVANDGPVTVTYIGSDAANYNFGFYVRDGADQPLFFNKVDTFGKTVTLEGLFAKGTEIVFSLNSYGSSPTTFLTGTNYARAGLVADKGFMVAFEDTIAGDFDYNDFVFGVTNVTNELPAVPLPAALPLMASAFGGFALFRRRRG
ncbi:VPLPA-CTERM sorting domain-containing protein [Paenirhodobacter sp.]|jgi:hypothetical protein|uniref:VPLPA-CTERM sorting domain-containing protein n=1 Tax=Paenirhodobacter sp. TaxID=1965326 RepID=UPI003B50A914